MKLTAELMLLAYSAVSTEETRYYLNGVHVEPHYEKGAILTSTDGRRMLVIHDADAENVTDSIVTLPAFVRQQMKPKKGLKLVRKVLSVDAENKTATVTDETINKEGAVSRSTDIVTAHNVIIDGTFPNWRKVCPSGEMEPTSVPAFNGNYLAEMGKIGATFMTNSYNSKGSMYFLRAKGSDDGAPSLVRWSGVHHAFGVLMPMRAEPVLSLPAFMELPEPEAAQ